MGLETAFEVGQASLQIKRIADTLVASQKDVFVRLPGLGGYYPMSIVNQSGHAVNHANTGNHLIQQGTCAVGYDGNPFRHLGDGTNFLYGSGAYGVTGLETWISSSLRGLTLGGWFMVDSWPASVAGLISRWGGAGNFGYGLGVRDTGGCYFIVSLNGTTLVVVDSGITTLSQWHFIVGRFTPSTEIAVFVDGDKTVVTSTIPASLNISTADFEVGRYGQTGSQIAHAKARDVFICAAALSDALIEEIRTTSTP